MSDIVIRAENLGKRYRIGEREQYRSMREALTRTFSAPARLFHPPKPSSANGGATHIWALKGVSFEVREGEVMGIIGRNGSGKSTLLKILARVTKPTEGRARVKGRVGSLLEVGTGFHPELTGRENVFLSGAILGMGKAEILRKFDQIVAFADVAGFIDTPVKHYSSGMQMRLAFAVAAHLDPEILLIDEVLAVGDTAFQKKCLGKVGDVARSGRTVLFVSHNMAAIESFCHSAVLLRDGTISLFARTAEVVRYYLEKEVPSSIQDSPLALRTDRSGNGQLRLTSFHVEDIHGNALPAVRSGMDVVFVFGFCSPGGAAVRNVDMGFSLQSRFDQALFVLYTSYVNQTFACLPKAGSLRCLVRNLPLANGRYTVGARVLVGGDEADWPANGVGFLQVETGDYYGTGSKGFDGGAPFLVTGEWRVSRSGLPTGDSHFNNTVVSSQEA